MRAIFQRLEESVSRYCAIWKASNNGWYLDLANKEHGDYEDATTYGYFRDEREAERFLDDNFSNPGGVDVDESGKEPPPKKSPNGDRVVDPASFRRQRGRW
jgi:hypothetical protein